MHSTNIFYAFRAFARQRGCWLTYLHKLLKNKFLLFY